jgi:ABC-type amino acid transport substrate-binding protein
MALSASLAVANAEGTGAHRPTAPHSLHVVSDDNYPPYLFRNADGEVEGYLVDLWRLWERKTGVPVTLTATNWAEAQRMIADGRADLIDMIYRTPSASRSTSSRRPTPICRWPSTPTPPSAASAA